MSSTIPTTPHEAAHVIWTAGIDAVRAETLVREQLKINENSERFCVGTSDYQIDPTKKICVVGGGKAAGYLAKTIEEILEPIGAPLHGWVNVPANCLVPTKHITLHAARPASVNEPRQEGIEGTQNILRLVASLDPTDLCLCLLTGGGSALLPAPLPGISLQDKIEVTRLLSSQGASIRELNRIRTAMSSIKGGGLSRACSAKQMISLIISDVIGDPLDLIASGPTMSPDENASLNGGETTESAYEILKRFAKPDELSASLWEFFAKQSTPRAKTRQRCEVNHHILANNGSAVQAAAQRARQLGFNVQILPPEEPNMVAEEVAARLIGHCSSWQDGEPQCLIWGGEPTVRLAPKSERGIGGRNQQLVLYALEHWSDLPQPLRSKLCVLSGGTDGEDGPTDAAGAWVDQTVVDSVIEKQHDVSEYLARNDAYTILDSVDALVKTGPTHTNVCDLRVAVLR